MKKFTRIAVLAAMLIAGGCGDGGNRPSEKALSNALYQDESFSSTINDFGESAARKIATCTAKTLRDSDVSGEFLRALVGNNDDFVPSDDDVTAMEATAKRIEVGCF